MPAGDDQIIRDALAIWRAGVAAVDSQLLVQQYLRRDDDQLLIGEHIVPLTQVGRIAVVGAGKAGAGMARGVEAALGSQLMAEKQLSGWLNVPADCVERLERIQLHPARPAAVNEPTQAAAEGTQQILKLLESLQPTDLCLCLISGGGSALLTAPVPGIELEDKQQVTRFLSSAGANIQELNTVRKQLSQVKGGRLARRCRAGQLVALIISDVLGDPLDVIASGPTVPDRSSPQAALDILQGYGATKADISPRVFAWLEAAARDQQPVGDSRRDTHSEVTNIVVGNNAVAVDAAGMEAERRGYQHAMISARELEPTAEEVATHLAEMACQMQASSTGPNCLISGGEPTVKLVEPDRRGRGGRNQQLVLAALCHLLERRGEEALEGIVLLSGGTDGEDGPTDAAGAIIHAGMLDRMRHLRLDPYDHLARNDAYPFFEALGGLIKTGPTHTNVCDLRVLITAHG